LFKVNLKSKRRPCVGI